jgi:hypothetical protein
MRCLSCVVKLIPAIFSGLSGFQLKLIATRHEFNSNNFIFTALNLLVRRLSFKTQFKIEFLGPFYGPKKSLKKTLFR